MKYVKPVSIGVVVLSVAMAALLSVPLPASFVTQLCIGLFLVGLGLSIVGWLVIRRHRADNSHH